MKSQKNLPFVVCFYLFVRLFAFSLRNLVAPFWSLQNPRIEELMKLTGTFQRLHRLSCFLFMESGSCLQSPSLSASSRLSSKFYEDRERELPIASFPDIGDSTAESDGGDSGESSLTRCCCFHLSPPVPQFPLTSPSTNTTTLSDQFPGST